MPISILRENFPKIYIDDLSKCRDFLLKNDSDGD